MRRFLSVAGATTATLLVLVLGVIPSVLAYHAQERAQRVRDAPWTDNENCARWLETQGKDKKGVRFAVLGDVQMGSAMFPKVLKACEKEPGLSFMVQTGDLVSRPRPGHYTLALSELATLRRGLPFLIIPGNHDVRKSAQETIARPFFRDSFGTSQFAFRYGDALFVFCDNSMGPLRDDQYAWLEDVLAQRSQPSNPVFVFMHAEPISWEGKTKRNLEAYYARFVALCKKYKVDYVFNGNWHGYYREVRSGTVFLVNGHGGDFDNDDKLATAYYTVVDFDGTTVTDVRKSVDSSLPCLAESYLDDFFIARWGTAILNARWHVAAVIILFALSLAFFLFEWSYVFAPERTSHALHRVLLFVRPSLQGAR